ncbi:bifunctional protein-serine/threonine kinase/phosphatase [Pseudorhizobium flavum]|uniref:Serine/threonine protein phosphatase PrpC n=1 Tax=Pseudorhizobium flavum TaxID=1335061 RepID=A0A7X0DE18_9HYPH|nr:bifunctional protein-serine/threonine kinase/phosphatase [Pseudorhizobium flavum]MBB6181518.1 serine/threonine protein phosphatase PrpC [Pseudorhizobium flavum]CAD6616784.1 bifunctional protein-serine/threonine kinase/phosphatase [Pseudorhizobium flavum]
MLNIRDTATLRVSIGQYSSAGRKPVNQDFHGAVVPSGVALTMKGVALAIADGISTSPVGHVAAETAVKSFLTDYYCTSDAWTVKTSASRVIDATNSWLHAQSRHVEDRDRAHVATFSALVLKGERAHIFHVGDSRIARVSDREVEPLTREHRLVLSGSDTQIAKALGLLPSLEIDYRHIPLQVGDVFVLTTDGIHDHLRPRQIAAEIAANPDLDRAAGEIAARALESGSDDNLTIQIVRIDQLPEPGFEPLLERMETLPPASLPSVPGEFEGYRVHRQIHASSRSHVFLASDPRNGEAVVLKFPSADLQQDEAYLRRFAMEEWVARRVSSVHVVKCRDTILPRRSLYLVMEHLAGGTLSQWMKDHPQADLASMRAIISQIADGLRALHRKEVIHQDLRPDNVLIDSSGTAKIIDLGSARVEGLVEAKHTPNAEDILGTFQYTAPEYFLGERGNEQSDLFSLGVIAYQIVTGRLPYGAAVARTGNARQQARLRYASIREYRPDVPQWVDDAVRKAVHPDPGRRYEAISEFLYDLSHPKQHILTTARMPLTQRNPLLFWQVLSLILALLLVLLLLWQQPYA